MGDMAFSHVDASAYSGFSNDEGAEYVSSCGRVRVVVRGGDVELDRRVQDFLSGVWKDFKAGACKGGGWPEMRLDVPFTSGPSAETTMSGVGAAQP